jgi:hypothetical protein
MSQKSNIMIENKPILQNEFNTPTDYFNQLNDVILNRLENEKKSKGKLRLLQWSVAASVILMIGVAFYSFNTQNTASSVSINNIEISEIESYLETNEISDEDLIELLNISELSINEEIQYNDILYDVDDDLLYQYE